MSQGDAIRHSDELAALLERLIAVQEALHDVVRDKLEAMRRVDVAAMQTASHREAELAAEAAELDRRRRLVTGDLMASTGARVSAAHPNLPLRVVAAAVDGTARDRLMNLGAALRAVMLKVAEANRTVELVCGEMLAHFKTVFEAMLHEDDRAATYSAKGRASGAAIHVVDAVG